MEAHPMTLSAEDVARLFHEAYERLAPSFGYETRRESAVPWEDVPEANRRLMEAVAAEVLTAISRAKPAPRTLVPPTRPSPTQRSYTGWW
jgi:hypothetical protein